MNIKVEVFSVGKWNGILFSRDDLNLMAVAFHKLKEFHKVPLKLGHNDGQPLTDGQPALGWLNDLSVEGDKLMANLSDVPDVVYNAINKGLYKHFSIELDFSVEHKGDFYPFVLSGIALLGADIPAVNNIGDLTKYMTTDYKAGKRALFTANKQTKDYSRGDGMSKELEAKIKALESQMAEKDSQISELATEKAKFERGNTELTAKIKLQEEQASKEKFDRKKKEFSASLDKMIEEKKILPAQREEFMKQFKEDDATIELLESNLKVLGMFKADNSSDGEQGNSDGDGDNEGKNPGKVLFDRARKMQREKGIDFSVAKRAVMEADPDLTREYVMLTGSD